MASLATCSISGLPINEGDLIKLIPLKKNKYLEHTNYGTITPSLVKMNDMFNPLTLPITGKYGEYDRIDDIVKNVNTDDIEKYYGMSIHSFIKIINCSRTFNDNFSELIIHFGKEKELRGDSYQKLNFEKRQRIDVQNNKKNIVYTHPHEKLKNVEFVYNDSEYMIYVYDSNTLVYKQHNQLTIGLLLNIIYQVFKIELNVIDEKAALLEELKGLTGMFVLDEIYQELVNNFKSDIESTLKIFESDFNDVAKEYQEHLNKLNNYKEKIKNFNESDTDYKELKFLINTDVKLLKRKKQTLGHSCMYLEVFKEWEKFGYIYFESVINGSLKKDLDEFWFFRQGMYLLNKQFMPNVTSYRQSESNLMILNKITHNILARRLLEQEIEANEYE